MRKITYRRVAWRSISAFYRTVCRFHLHFSWKYCCWTYMNSCHLQDLRVLLWLSSSSRRRRPTEGETRSRRLEERMKTALYFLSLYCSCYMPRTHLRIMKLHFTFCLSIVHVICQEHIWESRNCTLLSVSLLFMLYAKNTFENHETATESCSNLTYVEVLTNSWS